MRILWMLLLTFGAMFSLPYQRAMADQAGQPTQLGVAAGSAAFTTTFKLSLATDAKLKPGDSVNLYAVRQKKGLLSSEPLARDIWIAHVLIENAKILAIDRSRPLDPSALYISRMVRFEMAYKDTGRLRYFSPYRMNEADLVLGLVGDPPPHTCGDCVVLSPADYRAQYGPQCSIKTRRGSEVMKVAIPCPKEN